MSNPRRLSIDAFLEEMPRSICFDVRSPGEYQAGHIPGAISFPLFSDAERAEIGTVYKQQSAEKAFELGLLYTGPKMPAFVRDAKVLAAGKPILMYCWRGGQRSGAMAWLLAQAGLQVNVLEGGYKSWRQKAQQCLEQPYRLQVLGGATGSGKTDILHALAKAGAQVLDLEALAAHKGSAFGGIDMPNPPSQEHFINLMAFGLMQLHAAEPIWVEDESRMIGLLNIPTPFFKQMLAAHCWLLHVPQNVRIARLVADYGGAEAAQLRLAFEKIGRKLGGQHLKAALTALEEGHLEEAASIALQYYDRAYALDLKERPSERISVLHVGSSSPLEIAQQLLQLPSLNHE